MSVEAGGGGRARAGAAGVRVLQAMAGAPYGGAEAFFTRLVVALDKAGLEQHAVIRRHRARAEALRAAAVPVTELGFGGRLDWWTRSAFRRAVRRFRPEVVLTWMNRASAACPRGGFVHIGRLGGYYNLKYYCRCDHLVGNTRDIVAYTVASGWPQERVHYLPNFVAAEREPPVPRESLATPGDAPLLLAMGRLHANKAFDVLLEALKTLPGVYLWLAGAGPLEAELRALAARLGVAARVRFLGWREDGSALMAAADVLVCPSRREPLGNVVIEAWAQGLPVVAAASAGPAGLIEEGVTGLLVPPDDAGSLVAQIARLVDDPALSVRLKAKGRAAFEAGYTEATVVRRHLEFLRRVAG